MRALWRTTVRSKGGFILLLREIYKSSKLLPLRGFL
jgi:hypothetical protein